ncbi:hypothetical protein HNR23_004953 [Nocardiopsis mwathae]|uniref:J domain-containing protein n=1 Tax=Nocardiopsis mwathae TaxID=1472723 RepID=A0A7W9YMI2_9ACTN|nr:hypothetical protein [Nocardiopsis mwathae]MBB6174893.1 hypothetical protein [Nocardiopsis mwathae]
MSRTGRDPVRGRPLDRRRAYRSWIRENHPDRGGDPVAFAEDLARWRRALGEPDTRTSEHGRESGGVRVFRAPRGPAGWVLRMLRRRAARHARARRLR